MPTIRLEMQIAAPIERCFDLARSVELHRDSMVHTGEWAIAGVTKGLMGMGDWVTLEAKHFGVRQRLTSRITAYERPVRFVDEMVSGAFKRFAHMHEFVPNGSGTLMIDIFDYTSPLGPLGFIADRLFLERYMRALLRRRNAYIKHAAEAGHGEGGTE